MCPNLWNKLHLKKSTHPDTVSALAKLSHAAHLPKVVTALDLHLHVKDSQQNYCSEVNEILL
jgi:hypothetical protein